MVNIFLEIVLTFIFLIIFSFILLNRLSCLATKWVTIKTGLQNLSYFLNIITDQVFISCLRIMYVFACFFIQNHSREFVSYCGQVLGDIQKINFICIKQIILLEYLCMYRYHICHTALATMSFMMSSVSKWRCSFPST